MGPTRRVTAGGQGWSARRHSQAADREEAGVHRADPHHVERRRVGGQACGEHAERHRDHDGRRATPGRWPTRGGAVAPPVRRRPRQQAPRGRPGRPSRRHRRCRAHRCRTAGTASSARPEGEPGPGSPGGRRPDGRSPGGAVGGAAGRWPGERGRRSCSSGLLSCGRRRTATPVRPAPRRRCPDARDGPVGSGGRGVEVLCRSVGRPDCRPPARAGRLTGHCLLAGAVVVAARRPSASNRAGSAQKPAAVRGVTRSRPAGAGSEPAVGSARGGSGQAPVDGSTALRLEQLVDLAERARAEEAVARRQRRGVHRLHPRHPAQRRP